MLAVDSYIKQKFNIVGFKTRNKWRREDWDSRNYMSVSYLDRPLKSWERTNYGVKPMIRDVDIYQIILGNYWDRNSVLKKNWHKDWYVEPFSEPLDIRGEKMVYRKDNNLPDDVSLFTVKKERANHGIK